MIRGKNGADKGYDIFEAKGDWGEPGIPALSIVSTIFEIVTGEAFTTRYIGMGFQFDDILKRLKAFCRKTAS